MSFALIWLIASFVISDVRFEDGGAVAPQKYQNVY
jgi:hypothetical protein